jgi:hypothetical protein
MIWSERMSSGLRLRTSSLPMSLPCSRTSPSVASSSPISTLANVDLPQPDSPTIATVSASRASKSSFSLAFT